MDRKSIFQKFCGMAPFATMTQLVMRACIRDTFIGAPKERITYEVEPDGERFAIWNRLDCLDSSKIPQALLTVTALEFFLELNEVTKLGRHKTLRFSVTSPNGFRAHTDRDDLKLLAERCLKAWNIQQSVEGDVDDGVLHSLAVISFSNNPAVGADDLEYLPDDSIAQLIEKGVLQSTDRAEFARCLDCDDHHVRRIESLPGDLRVFVECPSHGRSEIGLDFVNGPSMNDSWSEPPIIWTAVVGESSAKKPCLGVVPTANS